MYYATLSDMHAYSDFNGSTLSDDLLKSLLDWATSYIDFYKGRHYDPRIETRRYDLPSAGSSLFGVFEPTFLPVGRQKPLRMDDDLLEVFELLNGDGTSITDYVLEPANAWPKMRVRLVNSEIWEADSTGNEIQVISLTGLYAFHDRYSVAWITNGQTVLDNPLSDSATTITVTNASIFKAGQLLRINDELLLLSDTDTAANTLTVERGAQGSTAAEHISTSAIKVYRLPGNIVQACIRLVKWRYSQRDADAFDKTYQTDSGFVSIPTAIPVDVMAVLGAPKANL